MQRSGSQIIAYNPHRTCLTGASRFLSGFCVSVSSARHYRRSSKQRAVKEELIVKVIGDVLDTEVTEKSVKAIDRVVITGQDIVVEKKHG